VKFVTSVPAKGMSLDSEEEQIVQTHLEFSFFKSGAFLLANDEKRQPLSRHFTLGRKLNLWFEIFLDEFPVLFVKTANSS
jgi:hypothetical protein